MGPDSRLAQVETTDTNGTQPVDGILMIYVISRFISLPFLIGLSLTFGIFTSAAKYPQQECSACVKVPPKPKLAFKLTHNFHPFSAAMTKSIKRVGMNKRPRYLNLHTLGVANASPSLGGER